MVFYRFLTKKIKNAVLYFFRSLVSKKILIYIIIFLILIIFKTNEVKAYSYDLDEEIENGTFDFYPIRTTDNYFKGFVLGSSSLDIPAANSYRFVSKGNGDVWRLTCFKNQMYKRNNSDGIRTSSSDLSGYKNYRLQNNIWTASQTLSSQVGWFEVYPSFGYYSTNDILYTDGNVWLPASPLAFEFPSIETDVTEAFENLDIFSNSYTDQEYTLIIYEVIEEPGQNGETIETQNIVTSFTLNTESDYYIRDTELDTSFCPFMMYRIPFEDLELTTNSTYIYSLQFDINNNTYYKDLTATLTTGGGSGGTEPEEPENPTDTTISNIDNTVTNIQNTVTNMNNSITNVENFLTDESYSENSVLDNMPSNNMQDITSTGIDNIFTTLKNAFTSNNTTSVVFTIPYTNNKTITIPSDITENIVPIIIKNLIRMVYWFMICRYIIKDIASYIAKAKSGDILSHTDTNIKTEML